jgi:hypothetical protein
MTHQDNGKPADSRKNDGGGRNGVPGGKPPGHGLANAAHDMADLVRIVGYAGGRHSLVKREE